MLSSSAFWILRLITTDFIRYSNCEFTLNSLYFRLLSINRAYQHLLPSAFTAYFTGRVTSSACGQYSPPFSLSSSLCLCLLQFACQNMEIIWKANADKQHLHIYQHCQCWKWKITQLHLQLISTAQAELCQINTWQRTTHSVFQVLQFRFRWQVLRFSANSAQMGLP